MKTMQIYRNYGVLGADKRAIYTESAEADTAITSDQITVKLPEGWDIAHNAYGGTLLVAPWGGAYPANEALRGNNTPQIRVYDDNGDKHVYNLEIIEGGPEALGGIAILMLDGCTRSEAEKHLQRGATIFEADDLKAHFADYMQEWGIDGEEQAAYAEMLESKKPLQDWGVVEQDGKAYFIQYVL